MTEQEMTGGDTLQDQGQESGGTLPCSEPKDFKECCFDLRGEIEILKKRAKSLKDNACCVTASPEPPIDYGEVAANLQLAYRHLEDARMRLGKAVQAYDGGISVYKR